MSIKYKNKSQMSFSLWLGGAGYPLTKGLAVSGGIPSCLCKGWRARGHWSLLHSRRVAAFNNSLRQGKYKTLRQTSYIQNCEPESSLYFLLNKMRTYKYELHVLAVLLQRQTREGLCTVGTVLCKLERENHRVVCCLFCKVLTLKSAKKKWVW